MLVFSRVLESLSGILLQFRHVALKWFVKCSRLTSLGYNLLFDRLQCLEQIFLPNVARDDQVHVVGAVVPLVVFPHFLDGGRLSQVLQLATGLNVVTDVGARVDQLVQLQVQ